MLIVHGLLGCVIVPKVFLYTSTVIFPITFIPQGLHQVKFFQKISRITMGPSRSKFYLVSYLVAISVNQNVAQKIHEGVGLAT